MLWDGASIESEAGNACQGSTVCEPTKPDRDSATGNGSPRKEGAEGPYAISKTAKIPELGKCINEEQPEGLEGMEYEQISTLTQTDYSKLLSILSICELSMRIMWPLEWPKQLQEHSSRENRKKEKKNWAGHH